MRVSVSAYVVVSRTLNRFTAGEIISLQSTTTIKATTGLLGFVGGSINKNLSWGISMCRPYKSYSPIDNAAVIIFRNHITAWSSVLPSVLMIHLHFGVSPGIFSLARLSEKYIVVCLSVPQQRPLQNK